MNGICILPTANDTRDLFPGWRSGFEASVIPVILVATRGPPSPTRHRNLCIVLGFKRLDSAFYINSWVQRIRQKAKYEKDKYYQGNIARIYDFITFHGPLHIPNDL